MNEYTLCIIGIIMTITYITSIPIDSIRVTRIYYFFYRKSIIMTLLICNFKFYTNLILSTLCIVICVRIYYKNIEWNKIIVKSKI